jgi:capsular exopolysaccharide synthesis family protein
VQSESLEPQVSATDPDEAVFNFDLRRYLDALRKYAYAVLALMAVSITGAVIYTSRLPRIYEAKASVQIEPRLPDLLGQGEDMVTVGTASGNTQEYYKQQRKRMASFSLVQQTVEAHQLYMSLMTEKERGQLKLDRQVEITTRRLSEMLKVEFPDQDRTMYVGVRNEDPKLAADIANWHIETYIAYTKNQLSLDTQTASNALSTEFDAAETKLREADAELLRFQKKHELIAVSLEDQRSLVSANIVSFTARVNEAKARRIELGAKLDRMKQSLKTAPDVLDTPLLMMAETGSFDTLRTEYYSNRNKFLELEKEVGPKHVDYQKQKAKVDDLHSALESEAKRIIGGVREQHLVAQQAEKELLDEVKRAKDEALDLAPKISAYNDLLRTKKTVEDRYNILRSRLSTSDMNSRLNVQNKTTPAKPLDAALVPESPVSPSMKINVGAAAVLSFFLGIGLVMLIVFLDRSIKRTTDAQQAAAAPVLGVIPMLAESDLPADDDKARDLYVHTHPTSHVAECCRSLRTNVMFSAADRTLKTIVVTSANPREGKTTSVMYLGTTMAQTGQKVLLVDTDMRRPRLHTSTSVPRNTGLSNLILGDQEFDDVIKATEIDNLFVLPCGPLPPNPAELLMGKRFEHVLEELQKRFDRIILDSPPVQAVTDAVILSQQADGVIFVVRAGKTLRDEIKRSVKQIRDVSGHVFGVLVNEFDATDRSGYYYNYYGYAEKTDEKGEKAA